MAVHNFWLEANIDGKESLITGGPKSKDGGLNLDLFIRTHKQSERILNIQGFAHTDGELVLYVNIYDDQNLVTYKLVRSR